MDECKARVTDLGSAAPAVLIGEGLRDGLRAQDDLHVEALRWAQRAPRLKFSRHPVGLGAPAMAWRLPDEA